ncbi:hypothetical protein AM228_01865 [Planktothricoides sp. SR001]|nr:hypothetical protein AM228_01865 [Planktothricoides sp. SR001]
MRNPVSGRMNEKPGFLKKPGFFAVKVMLKINNVRSLNEQKMSKICQKYKFFLTIKSFHRESDWRTYPF